VQKKIGVANCPPFLRSNQNPYHK